MPEFVNEAGGSKTFRVWNPKTGTPNGDPAEFEAAQVRVNEVMGTTPPARADQPSPTGDDGDPELRMKPHPAPRMQIGSAQTGWFERQVKPVDPREERE